MRTIRTALVTATLGFIAAPLLASAAVHPAASDKDSKDDTVYWFFELYSGDDAWAAHGKGDSMKAAMGAFGGLLAGAPEMHILSPVAAKGLDI